MGNYFNNVGNIKWVQKLCGPGPGFKILPYMDYMFHANEDHI